MLEVHVEFWRPAFHGLRTTGEPDWPPSPARLLGALKAGSHALEDSSPGQARALAILQRMAEAPPPVITAPRMIELRLPATYTEKTWKPSRLTNNQAGRFLDTSAIGMDTRSRTLKPNGGIALAENALVYSIELEIDDDELRALQRAAAAVPYFGTSKDPADITIRHTTDGETIGESANLDPETQQRWQPRARADGRSRGWLPNTMQWFDINYERVFGEDPVLNQLGPIAAHGYTQPLAYSPRSASRPGEFPIVPFTASIPHHSIREPLAAANRRLRAEGIPWTAFPATVSNSAHADGRLVGIGILPDSDEDRRHGSEAAEMVVESEIAMLDPASDSFPVIDPAALRARTWIGPSASWYSATPMRAFPDRRVLEYEVHRELGSRFNARVLEVRATSVPTSKAHRPWADGALADGLGQWWLEVDLAEPIDGPVVLGRAKDHGFGLFHPRGRS